MRQLTNGIQPYAWGSADDIAVLLGVEPTGEPQAEMWMGAHPDQPSQVTVDGVATGLGDLIAADPQRELGSDVSDRFDGRLPFLLKLLAAGQPLSLQAHPNAAQALEGFAREQAAGIAVDAPERSFRDQSHKPELICALAEFHALCGFRAVADTRELLDGLGVAGLHPVQELLDAADEREALGESLRFLLDRNDSTRQLAEAVAAACAEDRGPDRWRRERAWGVEIAGQYPGDPGVVTALLLNLVILQPGEALFLGAGNLHAYLRGFGVEIMANSNNVLRGGLTPKHIDVPALLEVVDPVPLSPAEAVQSVATAEPNHFTRYAAPVSEFALERLVVTDGSSHRWDDTNPAIVLCAGGAVTLQTDVGCAAVAPGHSVWVSAADGPVTVSGDGLVFRATVGG